MIITLTSHPRSLPVSSEPPSPILPEPMVESDHANTFMSHFETFQNRAKQALQFSQVVQQRKYNKGPLTLEFNIGDLVLVNPHSLSLLRSEKGLRRKLQMKYDGPFEVLEKYGPTTYCLQLPSSYGMHPVLNVSHLESYQQSTPKYGKHSAKHMHRADFTEVPKYEVEHIVAERWRKARNGRHVQELLTRFTGFNATYNEWLAASSVMPLTSSKTGTIGDQFRNEAKTHPRVVSLDYVLLCIFYLFLSPSLGLISPKYTHSEFFPLFHSNSSLISH